MVWAATPSPEKPRVTESPGRASKALGSSLTVAAAHSARGIPSVPFPHLCGVLLRSQSTWTYMVSSCSPNSPVDTCWVVEGTGVPWHGEKCPRSASWRGQSCSLQGFGPRSSSASLLCQAAVCPRASGSVTPFSLKSLPALTSWTLETSEGKKNARDALIIYFL